MEGSFNLPGFKKVLLLSVPSLRDKQWMPLHLPEMLMLLFAWHSN